MVEHLLSDAQMRRFHCERLRDRYNRIAGAISRYSL